MADLLPRLTWHMDEPTADPTITADYLVCREARKQATVSFPAWAAMNCSQDIANTSRTVGPRLIREFPLRCARGLNQASTSCPAFAGRP